MGSFYRSSRVVSSFTQLRSQLPTRFPFHRGSDTAGGRRRQPPTPTLNHQSQVYPAVLFTFLFQLTSSPKSALSDFCLHSQIVSKDQTLTELILLSCSSLVNKGLHQDLV